MKQLLIIFTAATLLTACATTDPLIVKVSRLGEEIPESIEKGAYMLPQTVLKVEVQYQELRSVPGPFREYAEKYLGIKEVIRQNSSQWKIMDFDVSPHAELDPALVFQVHQVEGVYDPAVLLPFIEKGLIMDGSVLVQEGIGSPELGVVERKDYLRFSDMGAESNFAERTETMYKTIITDTSFVEVPVDRTITEQKSPAMKAKEAADFILELRIRRFELLTGEYEGYPQGEAMQATLDRLDELEASYLSLFTGKALSRTLSREWFLVPEAGSEPSEYDLGTFSGELGFIPAELEEGETLKIRIEPLEKTAVIRNYYSEREGQDNNRIYYRIPDVADLSFMLGNTRMGSQRISVYQSGALISAPME